MINPLICGPLSRASTTQIPLQCLLQWGHWTVKGGTLVLLPLYVPFFMAACGRGPLYREVSDGLDQLEETLQLAKI